MRIDAWGGTPPPIERLDEFDGWAQANGFDVLRHYQPDYTDEDGTFYEGFWGTSLFVERRDIEGVVHFQAIDIADWSIARGWPDMWQHLGELLLAMFERETKKRGAVFNN
jgi:hypothetical protein